MYLEPIRIGSRRELFWDDTIVNRAESTTETVLHRPVQRECVLTFDEPWGGDGANYCAVLEDDGLYRLYVNLTRSPYFPGGNVGSFACYYESTDGVNWTAPSLGIYEFQGSTDNNIIMDNIDGFRVMKDENPACPPDQKYKALANIDERLSLFVSADAKRFTFSHILDIRDETVFDSVNTLLWNRHTRKYECFLRIFHMTSEPQNRRMIRGIGRSESEDLVHWSQPVYMRYEPAADWQMYTNNVSHYCRADHVYVGFPTRYVERLSGWTANYDELCGAEKRRERLLNKQPRIATALTEALFMTSRNGADWRRFGEAFLPPGPEHPSGWVYGSSYLSNGMIETDAPHPGCSREISMYSADNRWMGVPAQLWRYVSRLDGFASQHAPGSGAALVTRPIIFEGDTLYINFSTSAAGSVRIRLTAGDGSFIETDELFGDSTHRRVRFHGNPTDYAGRPVVLRFDMQDADLYSMKFE